MCVYIFSAQAAESRRAEPNAEHLRRAAGTAEHVAEPSISEQRRKRPNVAKPVASRSLAESRSQSVSRQSRSRIDQ